MMSPRPIRVSWKDLYKAPVLREISSAILEALQSINPRMEVITEMDPHASETTIFFKDRGNAPLSESLIIQLIPNELNFKLHSGMIFHTTKEFFLNDFPSILEFMKAHCPYIMEYIEEENVKSTTVTLRSRMCYPFTSEPRDIVNFLTAKQYLHREDNKSSLIPIVFSSIVKKFYNTPGSQNFTLELESCPRSFCIPQFEHSERLLTEKINLIEKTTITVGDRITFCYETILNRCSPALKENLELKFIKFITTTYGL